MILCPSTSPTTIGIAPDGKRFRFVETTLSHVNAISVDGTRDEWIHRVWLLRWTSTDVSGLSVFSDGDEFVIAEDYEDAQLVVEEETGESLEEPFKHPGERWVMMRNDKTLTLDGATRTFADWIALKGRSYLANRGE